MNFFQKCFKTTERHSLAVCGSICRENFFFHIIPFYLFNKKKLFKQILIFLRFDSFKHDRKNKLSEYFSDRFCDSKFMSNKKISQ